MPTASEVFGAPTASEAFPDDDESQGPISGRVADLFFKSVHPFVDVAKAMGQGAEHNWGAVDVKQGMADFDKAGVESGLFNDYTKDQTSIVKSFHEAITRPAIMGYLGTIKTGSAIFGGLEGGVGAVGDKLWNAAKDLASSPNLEGPSKLAGQVAGAMIGGPLEMASGYTHGAGGEAPAVGMEAAAERAAIRPKPLETTLQEARAHGVVGEGETGYFDAAPVSEPNMVARSEAAANVSMPPPPPPQVVRDPHEIARLIAPDTFNELDRLKDLQENLRLSMRYLGNRRPEGWVTDTPEMLAARARLVETDQQLRDLIPDVQTAQEYASALLRGEDKESYAFRDYVQARWLEKELQPAIQEAYEHADSVIPNTVKQLRLEEEERAIEKEAQFEHSEKERLRDAEANPSRARISADTGSLKSGQMGKFRRGRQQSFEIGQTVNVGFNKDLTVVAKTPEGYLLQKIVNGEEKWYEHVPHRGLFGIDAEEAQGFMKEMPPDGSGSLETGKPGGEGIPVPPDRLAVLEAPGESQGKGIAQGGLKVVEGTGEEKARGLSEGVQRTADRQGIEGDLGASPTYKVLQKDPRKAREEAFIKDNPDEAFRVAMGEADAPEGTLSTGIYKELVRQATLNNDLETLRKLKNSSLSEQVTTMAQSLGALAGEIEEDPLKIIKNIEDSRDGAFNRARTSYGMDQEIEKMSKEIAEAQDRSIGNLKPLVQQLVHMLECK